MGIGINTHIGMGNIVGKGANVNPFDLQVKALIARMDALGELPTAKQQRNINDTIRALKSYCLFDRRFDALWLGRGYGVQSTKLNWIKDAHNLTKGGSGPLSYADGVGYKSDGTTSYLSTNYKLSTDFVNGNTSDASMFIRLSGSISENKWVAAMGAAGSNFSDIAIINKYDNTGASNAIGSAGTGGSAAIKYGAGYTAVTRIKNSEAHVLVNNIDNAITSAINSSVICDNTISILAVTTANGSINYFSGANTAFEIAGIGGWFSHSEFLVLQAIFNTYISKL